jgi:hypothetical protein
MIWELGLGLWATFKGFRPPPILSAYERDVEAKAASVPA